ncbi:MAG TPA: DJ-1/PfpI family protein [Solirubrobacterales bacterium]|nr:DJ-1/PfpI family protein [Solirubrobacterales bacterium]
MTTSGSTRVSILIYDGLTALDAIGPYDVLRQVPGWEIEFVGKRPGEIRTGAGSLGLVADRGIAEADHPDILVVPGGDVTAVMADAELLDWIRAADRDSRWTTSVCTGSLILAAAGLLEGRRATGHWHWLEPLRGFGADPVGGRWVEDGKYLTAAGVAAGIDMALHLVDREVGPEVAQAIQLGIEYDPDPPFDAGSPAKAPAPIVEMVSARMRAGAATR